MRNLKGKIAVVTGAASGIGRELAVGLAREGCSLALADVDLEGLKETGKHVASAGARAIIARVDVSSRDEMQAFAGRVVGEYGAVDIVINNAGIVYTSVIEEISYGDFERVMNINFWGTVYGTRAFIGHLKKRESSNLVNISSVYGLWALATQGSYSASKFAVRGFTETLMQEMRGTGVTVSCVYPGGVRTNIILNSGSRKFDEDPGERERFMKKFSSTAFTTAGKAARVIIAGIRKNRKRIRIGPDAFLFDISQRLFPTQYQRLAPAVMRLMGLGD